MKLTRKLVENIFFGVCLGLLAIPFIGFFVMFACILLRNNQVGEITAIISGISVCILIGPMVLLLGLMEVLCGDCGGSPW